MGAVAD